MCNVDMPRIMSSLLAEYKMTKTQLAQEVGADTRTVCSWSLGRTEPSIDHLILIAESLNVSVGQLVGVEEIEEV